MHLRLLRESRRGKIDSGVARWKKEQNGGRYEEDDREPYRRVDKDGE
jgi:hypothetical protein